MATINELSEIDSLSVSDLLAIWSASAGNTRKASVATLATFLQDQITSQDDMETQYSSPSATGFSVTINPTVDGGDVWLVLTPTGAFAAGTIVLPEIGECVDKQEVLVNCTQAVTTLTINGNGNTVTGAPTTLAANAFFRLRYEAVGHVFYRVG